MKPTTASLLISCLALTGLATGAAPGAAQSPAPPITVEGGESPAGDAAAGGPAAGGAEQAAPPAVKPPAAPATAKKKTGEVLPWANKPLTPAAAPTGDVAAVDAAAAQCAGLFEAACRDLKTCAWIADVALQDGTQIPARCVARPPAPPKNAAKKTAPAKKAAKAPEGAETPQGAAAPAVKAAVTRIEDEGAPQAPAVTEKKTKPEPEAQAATAPPEEKAPEQPKPPQQAESKAPEKKAEEAKAPIVVKPPPAPAEQMPSFGSVQPVMPGGGNAVVVTVPPSE